MVGMTTLPVPFCETRTEHKTGYGGIGRRLEEKSGAAWTVLLWQGEREDREVSGSWKQPHASLQQPPADRPSGREGGLGAWGEERREGVFNEGPETLDLQDKGKNFATESPETTQSTRLGKLLKTQ